MPPATRPRVGAQVLLLDAQDRVLLIHACDPDDPGAPMVGTARWRRRVRRNATSDSVPGGDRRVRHHSVHSGPSVMDPREPLHLPWPRPSPSRSRLPRPDQRRPAHDGAHPDRERTRERPRPPMVDCRRARRRGRQAPSRQSPHARGELARRPLPGRADAGERLTVAVVAESGAKCKGGDRGGGTVSAHALPSRKLVTVHSDGLWSVSEELASIVTG